MLNEEQAHFREASQDCCNLLYFGVIRPFKGVEDLITAFDSIPQDEIDQYWLTIVGEVWEGWDLPAKLIDSSCYHERITFINRYVPDEEVAAVFSGADAVVLPYHRSSASGPLHISMSYGLPVAVTGVGGLTEAVMDYEGAIVVPPQDPSALQSAIRQAAALRGKRPTIYGSGTISRDFVHVDDVVAANVLAATVPGVGGLTCNIACGTPTTLDQLVAAVGAATGITVEPDYGPPRVGDVLASWADVSRASEILGYAAAVPFETGIARTVAWFRGQAPA